MRKNFTLLICLTVIGVYNTFAQVVTNGNDSGDGSLRQEIIDAGTGGTVTFNSSVATVAITSGQLNIPYTLTINAPSAGVTIDAGETSRIFNITGGTVVLNNLTITNGNAENGGGIYITNANVTLNDCTVSNNTADGETTSSGGGIYNDVGGVLTVNDGEISSNNANRAGGGIEDNSGSGLGIILSDVRMINNSAMSTPGNGGALHITGAGDSNLTGLQLFNNVASEEGGGFWNGTGTMTVDSCILLSNMAHGNSPDQGGGGIYNDGGILLVRNNTVLNTNAADGTSGSGGGIFNNQGSLTVQNSALRSNTANRAGGGIEEKSVEMQMLTLLNVEFTENQAASNPGNGGALHITGPGDSSITGGVVSTNVAKSEGGGLWNGSGTMTIDATEIIQNRARGDAASQGGGGIYNNGGTVTVLRNTVISNNIADGVSGSGGGVFSTAGRVGFDRVNITNNRANRAGGGIEVVNGYLLLINSNLLNNNAGMSPAIAAPGNGGGVHISGTANSDIFGGEYNGNMAASEGGALWNGVGAMIIRDCVISSNVASGDGSDNGGGGIFNSGGTLTVRSDSSLANNLATGLSGSGGAILSQGGLLTILNSEILNNSANRAGGGVEMIDGQINIDNSSFIGNDVNGVASGAPNPGNGGGLHVTVVSGPGTVNIVNSSVFSSNIAAAEGGALWNGSGEMNINGSTISNNTASGDGADQGGGGIYNLSGTLNVLNNAVISDNIADGTSGSGGGILNDVGGILTVTNSEITGNSSMRAGGGIEDNSGAGLGVTLMNVTLSNNSTGSSPGNGGGLHITGAGDSMITLGSVTDNSATSEGGGLWNGTGTMTVDRVTLDNNTAVGSALENGGGAIFNNGGTLMISQSTLSNNQITGASSAGGAIHNGDSGDVVLMRSTVSGNSSNGPGAGVANRGSSFEINASTIALNTSAGDGGGIAAVTEVSIKNTVVAYNSATTGADVFGNVTSDGYNLVQSDDLNVFTAMASDIEGVDPMLEALADNGGPTMTHANMEDSPTYNAGDPADMFDDQRGLPVFDDIRDIGSFESQVSLSISDFGKTGITTIYPNPTTGRFYVEVGNTVNSNLKLQIVSMTGQLMAEYDMALGRNEINIDGMSTGIYILNISDGNSKLSHKLVLQ